MERKNLLRQIVLIFALLTSLPAAANICNRSPAIQQAILKNLVEQTGREFTCHQVDGKTQALVKEINVQAPGLKALKPQDLEGLIGLERLDLSFNKLKEFPRGIEKLARLKEIFITDNELEGPIPDDWEKLVDLELVFMGRNRLSGPLPASWGNLKKLHYIFLSENRLSGPIPSSWGDISRIGISSSRLQSISWPNTHKLKKLERLDQTFSQQKSVERPRARVFGRT